MKSVKELSTDRAKLFADNKALMARVEGDGRQTLSAEEQQEWDKRDTEIDALGKQIAELTSHAGRKDKLATLEAELAKPTERQTEPTKPGARPDETYVIDVGKAGKLSIRPESQLYRRCGDQYLANYNSYLRGEKRDFEALGLQVGVDPKGGYAVPIAMAAGLVKFLDDDVTLRRLGTVLPPTTAKSVGVLSYDTDYADADWTAEVPASSITEDDAARFGKREMIPHLLTKLVKCSSKLLRSAELNIADFLTGRVGYKFSITENKAFLSGTGAQRPLGAFVASNDGVSTGRDVTCAATTTFTMDELINLKYSLKYQYQRKAQWLVHRDFMKIVRKLKTGTGEYYLGINGQPDMLLDCPVNVDENAPNTFTTGQYVAMLADWSFYWIQDSLGMEMQYLGELFALTNQVGWLCRKETDAMPVLAEAFARLKLA